MFIVSQDGDTIINSNLLIKLYSASEGKAIRAESATSTVYSLLGKFDTPGETAAAMDILATELKSGAVVIRIPSQEKAKNHYLKSRSDREYLHGATGKKVKGHGGS